MGNIEFPKKNSSVSASHLSSHTQKPLLSLRQTFPGSRYRRIFSEGLLKITEQGKLSAAKLRSPFSIPVKVKVKGSKTFARWWPTSSCPTRIGASDQQVAASPPVQLDLHQLAPLLLLLLGVLLLALLLLLVEVAAPLAKQGKISFEFLLQICFLIWRDLIT